MSGFFDPQQIQVDPLAQGLRPVRDSLTQAILSRLQSGGQAPNFAPGVKSPFEQLFGVPLQSQQQTPTAGGITPPLGNNFGGFPPVTFPPAGGGQGGGGVQPPTSQPPGGGALPPSGPVFDPSLLTGSQSSSGVGSNVRGPFGTDSSQFGPGTPPPSLSSLQSSGGQQANSFQPRFVNTATGGLDLSTFGNAPGGGANPFLTGTGDDGSLPPIQIPIEFSPNNPFGKPPGTGITDTAGTGGSGPNGSQFFPGQFTPGSPFAGFGSTAPGGALAGGQAFLDGPLPQGTLSAPLLQGQLDALGAAQRNFDPTQVLQNTDIRNIVQRAAEGNPIFNPVTDGSLKGAISPFDIGSAADGFLSSVFGAPVGGFGGGVGGGSSFFQGRQFAPLPQQPFGFSPSPSVLTGTGGGGSTPPQQPVFGGGGGGQPQGGSGGLPLQGTGGGGLPLTGAADPFGALTPLANTGFGTNPLTQPPQAGDPGLGTHRVGTLAPGTGANTGEQFENDLVRSMFPNNPFLGDHLGVGGPHVPIQNAIDLILANARGTGNSPSTQGFNPDFLSIFDSPGARAMAEAAGINFGGTGASSSQPPKVRNNITHRDLTGFQARAEGGDIAPDKATIVGEKGPEVVVPGPNKGDDPLVLPLDFLTQFVGEGTAPQWLKDLIGTPTVQANLPTPADDPNFLGQMLGVGNPLPADLALRLGGVAQGASSTSTSGLQGRAQGGGLFTQPDLPLAGTGGGGGFDIFQGGPPGLLQGSAPSQMLTGTQQGGQQQPGFAAPPPLQHNASFAGQGGPATQAQAPPGTQTFGAPPPVNPAANFQPQASPFGAQGGGFQNPFLSDAVLPQLTQSFSQAITPQRFDNTELFRTAGDVFARDQERNLAGVREEFSGLGLGPGSTDRESRLLRTADEGLSRFRLGQLGVGQQSFENAEGRRINALGLAPGTISALETPFNRQLNALPALFAREQQPLNAFQQIAGDAANRQTQLLPFLQGLSNIPFNQAQNLFGLGEQARGVADTDLQRQLQNFFGQQGFNFNQALSLIGGTPPTQTEFGPSTASQLGGLGLGLFNLLSGGG